MKRGRGSGWLCIPPFVLRCIALGLIALGILLLVLFVPARYWMALIGLMMILAGIAIYYMI